MDRIDMVVDVARLDPSVLLNASHSQSSADLRTQVLAARQLAEVRGLGPTADLRGSTLLHACGLDASALRFLEQSARSQRLSGRGVTRLLRVARTCADIAGADAVTCDHLCEALGYRAREVD